MIMQSFEPCRRLIISLFIGNSGVLTALNSAFKYTGHLLHNAVHRIMERACRYITRPAVSTERLSLTAQGNIRYRLKTPYRDGTTDVVFEPQGEGQDARSTLWPDWPPWYRHHASTSRVTTGSLRRTTDCVNK